MPAFNDGRPCDCRERIRAVASRIEARRVETRSGSMLAREPGPSY